MTMLTMQMMVVLVMVVIVTALVPVLLICCHRLVVDLRFGSGAHGGDSDTVIGLEGAGGDDVRKYIYMSVVL